MIRLMGKLSDEHPCACSAAQVQSADRLQQIVTLLIRKVLAEPYFRHYICTQCFAFFSHEWDVGGLSLSLSLPLSLSLSLFFEANLSRLLQSCFFSVCKMRRSVCRAGQWALEQIPSLPGGR